MNSNLNLDEKEKRVLRSLYELSDISISKIAKETLINRTTLYPILNKLVAKGLISKLIIEKKLVFRPIPLNELKHWVKIKEKDFKKIAKDLLNWSKSIKSAKGNSLFSDVKYFEGFDAVKNLYADTWRDNKGKIIYAITDYKGAYECMSDFFRKEYFKDRVDYGVKVKSILPESAEGRNDLRDAKKLLREMKFIKIFQDLNIEINIYDDKIAVVAFDKKNPSGVLIKNERIASAFKNIFMYIWKK